MAFLGLEVGKAAPGYRIKRFIAFIIDVIIVLFILFIVYSISGKPDFPKVKAAMDAAGTGSSQAVQKEVFNSFDSAYWQSLFIWFLYEVLTQLIFSGATIGKLIMRLKIVPMNPGRNWVIHNLLMIVRSALKFIFLYLFQGFPFIISELTIFANKEARSGFDMFVKTRVKDLKAEG